MDNTDRSDLLLKKVSGIATPDEEAIANNLIKEDPAAMAEWKELEAQYHRSDVQQHLKSIDLQASFKKIVQPVKSRKLTWMAAAAVTATILVVATLYFFRTPEKGPLVSATNTPAEVTITLANGKKVVLADSGTTTAGSATFHAKSGSATFQTETVSSALNTLVVPHSKLYTLKLPDGSLVHLNASTTLKFPFAFTDRLREIYVDGEAYFNIVSDPNNPFLVHTSRGTIAVMGTSFNVNTYSSLKVCLQRGTVSVSTYRGPVKLTPGNALIVDSLAGRFDIEPFDPDEAFSWISGQTFLSDVSLAVVAAEMERQYDITVKIDDKDLESLRYTVIIDKKRPLEVFLKNLEAICPCEIDTDKQGTIHFH